MPGNRRSLQVGSSQSDDDDVAGWCNSNASSLFSLLDQLVQPAAKLTDPFHLFFPEANPGLVESHEALTGRVLDVSATWFIAYNNSAHPGFKGFLMGDELEDVYNRTATSDQECAARCSSYWECQFYTFNLELEECLFYGHVDSSFGGPRVYVGSYTAGFCPLLYGRDSRYLLYHVIPYQYCEDQVVAAGTMNTILGITTGQALNLTFGRNANGKMTVTALSAYVNEAGIVQAAPKNVTLTVLDFFNACHITFYILSDDLFPPLSTNDLDAPPVNETWLALARADLEPTREAVDVLYKEGCWNPLRHVNLSEHATTVVASPNNTSSSDSGMSIAAIVGIAAGSIVALFIIVVVPVVCVKWRCSEKDVPGRDKQCQLSEGHNALVEEYLNKVPQDWVIKNVKIVRKIGTGGYGMVYLGRWHDCNVAVKRFIVANDVPNEDVWNKELTSLQKEVSIMAGLRHPNVVRFLGVTMRPPSLVMEHCERGSLYEVLAQAAAAPLGVVDWKRRILMGLDAAMGMQFLHNREEPILHRDLKSPNLLVDKSWRVKVADFGLSKIIDPVMSRTSTTVFNPRWMAPEMIATQAGRSSIASDVYSFGIILWELLTLQEPFADANPGQIIWNVVQNAARPPIPHLDELPGGTAYLGVQRYIDLMQRCWAQDPQHRPTFNIILKKLEVVRDVAFGSAFGPTLTTVQEGASS